jgi:DNA primase
MAEQLEEIKKKIDIVELITEYVPLKKVGRNFKALCPFHSETNPSFYVSPERQIWHCFSCEKGGDAFSFLMEMEGMEFAEALRVLARRAGVVLRRFKPSPLAALREKLYEINHLAAEFYHYLLTSHKIGEKALEYLLKRGINRRSIEEFRLGFAPGMWDGLIKFLVGKKKHALADLQKAGLVIMGKRNFYDRFRGRVIFPIFDHRGNIVGFGGRVVEEKAEVPKYINTPETEVYHKSETLYGLWQTKREIKKENKAVVVEGETDMISSYQSGVKNVVAIKGSALTEGQVGLLKRYCENIFLALDMDVAGDAAARRGIEVADEEGLNIKVVRVKEGKDPDECIRKNRELWIESVSQAVPIYDFWMDSAFERYGDSAMGKRRIGQELLPILARIADEIMKAHYIKKLAVRLGVSEEVVLKQMEKVGKIGESKGGRKVYKMEEERKTRRERLEEYLLALFFQGEEEKMRKRVSKLTVVETMFYRRIVEELKKYFSKYKKFFSEKFAKILPTELVEGYNKLYLLDLANLQDNEENLSREFKKVLGVLRLIKLKEELAEISLEIKKLEDGKELSGEEKKRLKVENKKFSEKLKKLRGMETEEEG